MSNPYGYGNYGQQAPQYTPNQLLAQQYGQGSRAFYSPFNSPYRPQGVPAGGFQPPRGYGGGYGGMPSPQYASPMGGMNEGSYAPMMGPDGRMHDTTPGSMAGSWAPQPFGGPPGMPGPSVYQPQMGMQQPQGAAGDYYHALSQQMGGNLFGGMAPGGFAPAQMGRLQDTSGNEWAQMPPDQRAWMQRMGVGPSGQAPGAYGPQGPPQSGLQYGLDAMKNFASQQNAGPPPSAYQPASVSAGVQALQRGDPNAQNILRQAAGLPPLPPLPSYLQGPLAGSAFQNAQRSLQGPSAQQQPQPAGLPVQSGRDYGLQATQNFASQQNAGPPPAQPFGPAFRNAVNQLQVRPPAAPQRLPYQPGATAQMMQLGRRAPGLPATTQAGRTSSGIQPDSGSAMGPPPLGSTQTLDPNKLRPPPPGGGFY